MLDTDVLSLLESRAELFSFKDKQLYLFSKNGFTAELKKKARERVALVSYKDM